MIYCRRSSWSRDSRRQSALFTTFLLLSTFTDLVLSRPHSRPQSPPTVDDLPSLESPTNLPTVLARTPAEIVSILPLFPNARIQKPHTQDISANLLLYYDTLVSRTSPSLQSLQLPTCALTCYLNLLTTDGCASETDFKCHCSTGNIIGKAADCIAKSCSDKDQKDADYKIKAGCKAVGVDVGNGNGNADETSSGGGSSSTKGGGSSTGTAASMTRIGSATSGVPTSTGTISNGNNNSTSSPTLAPAPGVTSVGALPSASASSHSSTTNEAPMPTDTPLALLPSDRQLSTGAKAGISLSVSIFASAILLSLWLYIRRLKRDLKLAQAAAGVPESVWRASIQTAAAPSGVGRRRSWGGRGRNRRRSWDPSSPVSPLSPHGMAFVSDGFPGLGKKKRGHVLSVVVEREDEDGSSAERIVHEPVAGQKEGLADPLELDGEHTGIVELPTSITPRARSMERSRERGASLGESSRPSTSGLEKIDERSGV